MAALLPIFIYHCHLDSSCVLQPDMAMDLAPGSIFVHRNLGGLVNHKDLNAMSCLEYALVLGVKHVIVSGHYNCGAPAGSRLSPLAAMPWAIS